MPTQDEIEFPIPSVSPHDAPNTTITINDEWLSFLVGLAQNFLYFGYWQDESEADRELITGLVTELLDILSTED